MDPGLQIQMFDFSYPEFGDFQLLDVIETRAIEPCSLKVSLLALLHVTEAETIRPSDEQVSIFNLFYILLLQRLPLNWGPNVRKGYPDEALSQALTDLEEE